MNIAADRILGPIGSPRELKFRAESHAKTMMKDFDDMWQSGGATSDKFISSLVSIGTDCLLIEDGVCVEGKLHMAAAIAGMIYDLGRNWSDNLELSAGESVRKQYDIMNGGEMQIVGFFNRRTSCCCLKGKYERLKETQEKMGRCDNCMKLIELKKIMPCSKCRFVQVITVYHVYYELFSTTHLTILVLTLECTMYNSTVQNNAKRTTGLNTKKFAEV